MVGVVSIVLGVVLLVGIAIGKFKQVKKMIEQRDGGESL